MSRTRSSSRRRGRALGLWGFRRREAGGERARIARELRCQMLHEVDLVDVAARDRVADALDRRRRSRAATQVRRQGPKERAEPGSAHRRPHCHIDNVLVAAGRTGSERQRARLGRCAASGAAGSSTRGRSRGRGRHTRSSPPGAKKPRSRSQRSIRSKRPLPRGSRSLSRPSVTCDRPRQRPLRDRRVLPAARAASRRPASRCRAYRLEACSSA